MESTSSNSDKASAKHPTSPAFVTPIGLTKPAAQALSQTQSTCPRCCENRSEPVPRRSVLRRGFLGAASLVLSGWSFSTRGDAASAADAPDGAPSDEPVCKNCSGSGKVPCELCSGTGFWRALSGSDPKQRYKGVVCPECEGVGTLTCPVCLGTGEGNIRGLLRRRRVEPGPGRILQS